MYTHPQWVRRGYWESTYPLGEEAPEQPVLGGLRWVQRLPAELLYLAHGYGGETQDLPGEKRC